MKIRVEHIVWLLLMVFVVGGCQSVATTSAMLRNQEGNFELAIGLAKQGIQENPRDAEAYFQLGIAYSNLDSVALAYENFTTAKELDPGPKRKENADNNIKHNYSKHYNSGQAAFQDHDLQAASAEFTLATQADPRQSVAYYNLGVAYARLADADTNFTEQFSPYHDQAIAVLKKLHADFEVIIVDDGSSDATAGIADQLARQDSTVSMRGSSPQTAPVASAGPHCPPNSIQ